MARLGQPVTPIHPKFGWRPHEYDLRACSPVEQRQGKRSSGATRRTALRERASPHAASAILAAVPPVLRGPTLKVSSFVGALLRGLAVLMIALGATAVGSAPALAQAPTVTSVSPNQGTILGGTPVTITGTNFTGATSVTFGGTAATGITVVNATTITATTPAHAAGLVNVAVTTPVGTGTGANAYTYVAPPTVANVSPNTGTTLGGTAVTITGTNFTGATSVTFGGTRRDRCHRRQRHHHHRHHAGARRRARGCRRHHAGRHRHPNERLHLRGAADGHQRQPQ